MKRCAAIIRLCRSRILRGDVFARERRPDDRVTLSEMRLIISRNGERQERALKNEEEYATVLREHFGAALKD
jgi:arylamine N-acetyltransferase